MRKTTLRESVAAENGRCETLKLLLRDKANLVR